MRQICLLMAKVNVPKQNERPLKYHERPFSLSSALNVGNSFSAGIFFQRGSLHRSPDLASGEKAGCPTVEPHSCSRSFWPWPATLSKWKSCLHQGGDLLCEMITLNCRMHVSQHSNHSLAHPQQNEWKLTEKPLSDFPFKYHPVSRQAFIPVTSVVLFPVYLGPTRRTGWPNLLAHFVLYVLSSSNVAQVSLSKSRERL